MSLNYNAFKRVFLTKSSKILQATIANSQKREAKFSQSGNTSAAAVEINRIQAAADVLDSRGFYNGSAASNLKAAYKVNFKMIAVVGMVVAFVGLA